MKEWEKLKLFEEALGALKIPAPDESSHFAKIDQGWVRFLRPFRAKEICKGGVLVTYTGHLAQVAKIEDGMAHLHYYNGQVFAPPPEGSMEGTFPKLSVAALGDSAILVPTPKIQVVWETIQSVLQACRADQYERLKWWFQLHLRAKILEVLTKI